ncbi:MAG: hypothetical protein H5T95_11245 [Firmicutes bacterium]|nr:hypothetical protein [Bacillota bacterium]
MSRARDLDRFYEVLARLQSKLGGCRCLGACGGRGGDGWRWPLQGVYFFFEPGEMREDGRTPRVVRVGTHAVSEGSKTTLWQRLSRHKGHERGKYAGGGNHRGSVFRLHVGAALLAAADCAADDTGDRARVRAVVGDPVRAWAREYDRDYLREVRATWGKGSSADQRTRDLEHPLECQVSAYIRRMPFLWVAVPGPAGTSSPRSIIESNAVALLSNRHKPPIDPPSPNWLGLHAARAEIRESGLWNVNYVDQPYDPSFIELLDQFVAAMGAP